MSESDRRVGVIVYAEDGDEALLKDFVAFMNGPEGAGSFQIAEGVPLTASPPSARTCAISMTGMVISSLVKALEVYMFKRKCTIKVNGTTIEAEYRNAAEAERVLDKAAAVTISLARQLSKDTPPEDDPTA